MYKRLIAMLLVVSLALSVSQNAYAMEQSSDTSEDILVDEKNDEDFLSTDEITSNEDSYEENILENDILTEESTVSENNEQLLEEKNLEINHDKIEDLKNLETIECGKSEDNIWNTFSIEDGDLAFRTEARSTLQYRLYGKSLNWRVDKATYNIGMIIYNDEFFQQIKVAISTDYNGDLRETDNLSLNTKYNVMYVLIKDKVAIAKFSIDSNTETVIQTPDIKDPVVFSNVKVYSNEIKFDYEIFNNSIRRLAIIDEAGNCFQTKSTESGLSKGFTVNNLAANSEYTFKFTDENGKLLYEKKISTASSNPEGISVELEPLSYASELNIKYEIKDCKYKYDNDRDYNNDSCTVRIIYNDEEGVHKKLISYDGVLDTENCEATFNTDGVERQNISGLFLSSKTYNINFIIYNSNYAILYEKNLQYKPSSKHVDSNSKVDITVDRDEAYKRLRFTAQSSTIPKDVPVYYAYQYDGIDEITFWVKSAIGVRSSGVDEIMPGIPFTLYAFIDGYVFKEKYCFGSNPYSLETGKGEDDQVYANGFKKTVKLLSTEALDSEYTLKYAVKNRTNPETIGTWEKSDKLTAENNYTAQLCTSYMTRFMPENKYSILYKIYDENKKLVYCSSEELYIRKLDVNINAAGDNKVTVSMNNLLPEKYLDFFYSYQDITEGVKNEEVYGTSSFKLDSEGKASLSIGKMKARHKYRINIFKEDVNNSFVNVYSTIISPSIQTTGFCINNLYAGRSSITFDIKDKNDYDTEHTRIRIFVREKGKEWDNLGSNVLDANATASVNIFLYHGMNLKSNTNYEVAVGYSQEIDVNDPNTYTLIKTTTKEDKRKVTIIDSEIKRTGAKLSFTYTQDAGKYPTRVNSYYRKAGSKEWVLANTKNYGTTPCNENVFDVNLTDLSKETEYEYKVDLEECLNVLNTATNKIVTAYSGSFTSLGNDIILTFKSDKSLSSPTREIIKISASSKTYTEKMMKLQVMINGEKIPVTLYKSMGFNAYISVKNLEPSHEYTIDSAEIYGAESDYIDTVEFENIKFTTKAEIWPTSIALNVKSMTLNMQSLTTGQLLVKEMKPVGCEIGVIYTSGDTKVVTVDQNGLVTAVGVGSTNITVTSKYNEKIKAVCKVSVNDYVVGQLNNDTVDNLENKTIELSRMPGEKVKIGYDIGLFETDGSTYTPVDGAKFVSSNSDIISFDKKEKAFYAVGFGEASILCNYKNICIPVKFNTVYGVDSFVISALTNSNNAPAFEKENSDNEYIVCVSKEYNIILSAFPSFKNLEKDDFNFVSSDSSIASIDTNGLITTNKTGNVTITAIRKKDLAEFSVVIDIRAKKSTPKFSVNPVLNVQKKLSDIEVTEGWYWKNPNESLFISPKVDGVSTGILTYDSGDIYYPGTSIITIKPCKVNGLNLYEKENPDAKLIICDNPAEGLTLKCDVDYYGTYNESMYVDLVLPKGITATKAENTSNEWKLLANENKSYTVTGNLYYEYKGKTKLIASTKKKITFTDLKQTAKISIVSDEVSIEDNTITISNIDTLNSFVINGKAYDKNGSLIDCPLAFKSSNKGVLDISSRDGKTATVNCKRSGFATILISSKDLVQTTETINVLIKDYKPVLTKNTTTVNKQIDYSSRFGVDETQRLGYSFKIVPVLDSTIANVELYDDSECNTRTTGLSLLPFKDSEAEYYLSNQDTDLKSGTYTKYLKASVEVGEERQYFVYPIKIKIIDVQPTVKLKVTKTANLFYADPETEYSTTVSNGALIAYTTGFNNSYYNFYERNHNTIICAIEENAIDGKLLKKAFKKTPINVHLRGYRNPYTITLSIKTKYQEPKIVTKNATTSVSPLMGKIGNSFRLYSNTDKEWLTDYSIDLANGNVFITDYNDNIVNYEVSTNAKSQTAKLSVEKSDWRYPVTVKHTIKVVNPTVSKKATYSEKTFVVNNNYGIAKFETQISSDLDSYDDIVVKGANAASKALITSDKITVVADKDSGKVTIYANDSTITKEKIKPGSYSFIITPYTTHPVTLKRVALTAGKVTMKVTDKEIGLAVSCKGGLNLIDSKSKLPVTLKLSNVPTGTSLANCYIYNYDLSSAFIFYQPVGTMTKDLNDKTTITYWVTTSTDNTNLASNKKYKIYFRGKFKLSNGQIIYVNSNDFVVRTQKTEPKISLPKEVGLVANSSSLATSDVDISVPAGYKITDCTGYLDIDKDGKKDIEVKFVSGNPQVTIINKYAVKTSEKGTLYKVPIQLTWKYSDSSTSNKKITLNVRVY